MRDLSAMCLLSASMRSRCPGQIPANIALTNWRRMIFVKRFLKLAVAGILIVVLLRGFDFSEAAALISRLHWWALAIALLAMIGEMLLSAWKWSRALTMHGMEFPYGYLLRTCCTGYFFNNFLPTSIGGDAYRVLRTLPTDGYRSRAVSAVLVDRVIGIGALLSLGAVGAVVVRDIQVAHAYLILYTLAVAAGLVLIAAMYFGWFRALTERLRHLKAVDAIEHNLDRLSKARAGWVQQIVLSVAFQCSSIGIVYWLFMQTGDTVPFALCALIAAAAGTAALLPLSINGVGLMEGSFVAMAAAVGIDYDQALLVAVVRRLIMLTLSLLCGLVYLAEGRPAATDATSEAAGIQR
jgi:uncharacterized protein (TIRG00374 family)